MKSGWIILAVLCCIPGFFLLGSEQVRSGEVRVAIRAEILGKDFIKTEWRTSREVLERQARWDGLSAEAPLRVERACKPGPGGGTGALSDGDRMARADDPYAQFD